MGTKIIMKKKTKDGRIVEIMPLTFGRARIIIGDGHTFVDNGWWYDTPEAAVAALTEWDPDTQVEPEGWMRHPKSGRRRPDGDKSKEYVRY